VTAKKALLKRLEALEGVLSRAQIGARQRELERLSDEELEAIEAWYEAGQPGEWSLWVEERLAQQAEIPLPDDGSAVRDREDPGAASGLPPPPEVTDGPRSARRVRLSTDPPEPHPRRGKSWEVTMRAVESGPAPKRFTFW
jgi:hypothetical protein